ncbi:DUF4019 domain-containing protein [Congregibacter litoralis]|uniref:DUF4019 domain-containing protein n=1 Tax=Congregibacter litoralis TaxID=393662 RepID=UPI000321AE6A|nr:DUF4019 domain-containing protein [Congregibacter litoralis]
MKRLISISIALLFSVACLAAKPDEVSSAISWLEVVDSGSYKESWNQAAPFFQNQLSSSKWVQALNQVRAPLGNVLSRQVENTSSHSSLPGVPDGEYVVLTLTTSFEQKKSATETITVSKVNGEWHAVGYFIK